MHELKKNLTVFTSHLKTHKISRNFHLLALWSSRPLLKADTLVSPSPLLLHTTPSLLFPPILFHAIHVHVLCGILRDCEPLFFVSTSSSGTWGSSSSSGRWCWRGGSGRRRKGRSRALETSSSPSGCCSGAPGAPGWPCDPCEQQQHLF